MHTLHVFSETTDCMNPFPSFPLVRANSRLYFFFSWSPWMDWNHWTAVLKMSCHVPDCRRTVINMHVLFVCVLAFGINPQKHCWPFVCNHMVNSERCPCFSSAIDPRKTQNHGAPQRSSITKAWQYSVPRLKKWTLGKKKHSLDFYLGAFLLIGTLHSVLWMRNYRLQNVNNINIWLCPCSESQTSGITTLCLKNWIHRGVMSW